MTLRLSEAEYQALKNGRELPAAKPAKYRNVKKEVNGLLFDSTKEANRYVDLLNQQMSGQITELSRQISFEIEVNDVQICDYVADFCYRRGGEYTVEDVKSKVTRKLPLYQVKKKLMLAVYGIAILET